MLGSGGCEAGGVGAGAEIPAGVACDGVDGVSVTAYADGATAESPPSASERLTLVLVRFLVAHPIVTNHAAYGTLNDYRIHVTDGGWGLLWLVFVV